MIDIGGEITWDDASDPTGRPESVTVNLLADGVAVDSVTVEENEDHEWAYEFEGVDKFAGAHQIVYTVTEDAIEGYVATVDGYDIENALAPDEPEEQGSESGSESQSEQGSESGSESQSEQGSETNNPPAGDPTESSPSEP